MDRAGPIAAVLLLAACGQTRELEVTHFRRPCYGFVAQTCTVFREVGTEAWLDYYGTIFGLDPKWQHEYLLEVDVDHVDPFYGPGVIERYSVNEVQSERQVAEGTRFELDLDGDHLAATGTQSYSLIGERDLICRQPEDCERIAEILEDGLWFRAELSHPASPEEPLIIESLKP